LLGGTNYGFSPLLGVDKVTQDYSITQGDHVQVGKQRKMTKKTIF
jgi:hypothetical protein